MRASSRRGARTTGLVVAAACILALAPVAPAQAVEAAQDIWPAEGAYLRTTLLGPVDARRSDRGEPWDFGNGHVFQPGEFVGYSASTAWPTVTGGLPACAPASDGDQPAHVWALVDDSGAVLAPAAEWGLGEAAVAEHREIMIFTEEEMAAPVRGLLQVSCTHSDGTPATVVDELPLTIDPNLDPLYGDTHQRTLAEAGAGKVSLNAVGYAPGEQVTVSILDGDWQDPALLGQSVVTADGAGGIHALVTVPDDWSSSEWARIVAAGPTSRYALSEGFYLNVLTEKVGELRTSLVPSPEAPAGEAVQVRLTGYPRGSSVVVAMHSPADPVVLGSLTVASDGTASGRFPLSRALPDGATIWAGEKEGLLTLLSSTPIPVTPVTALAAGASLTSADGRHRLSMQGDGNLVIYAGSTPVFNTATFVPGSRAIPQGDGNLVIYGPDDRWVWQSGTGGNPGATFFLDGGALTITSATGTEVFTSTTGTGIRNTPAPAPSTARVGNMTAGDQVTSTNGSYRLALQGDGNLVLYTAGNQVVWHAGTHANPGARLAAQGDGNHVIYSATGQALWHTRTPANPGATATLTDTGTLQVTSTTGTILWTSR